MSGTRAGALKAVATLKARNPKHFQQIGKLGGAAGRHDLKGFAAMDDDKHHQASVKGGQTSRRTKEEQ